MSEKEKITIDFEIETEVDEKPIPVKYKTPSSLVVQIANQMNNLRFKDFTAVELDLLMTLCSIMKNHKTDLISIDFENLRALSKYDPTVSAKKFALDLQKTYKKLININFEVSTEKEFIGFVLFIRYNIRLDEQTAIIRVNPEFQWVLNVLSSNFTRFELNEFLDLKGKYAKDIYRHCKKFRTTGAWHVSIEEFRRLLDIPETYSIGMIDKRVLTPAIKELEQICVYFKVDKVYKKINNNGKRQGRPFVSSLHFSFEFLKKDVIDFNQTCYDAEYEIKEEPKVDKKRYLSERTIEKLEEQEKSKKEKERRKEYYQKKKNSNVGNFKQRPFKSLDEEEGYYNWLQYFEENEEEEKREE